MVLAFGEQSLPLPKRLAGHLVDHFNVDDELQTSLGGSRLSVSGAEPDWDVDLVALDCAAHDRVRFCLGGVAEPEPVVQPVAESITQLSWQFWCRRLILERNDCHRPYVRGQPAAREAVREAGGKRDQDKTINSRSSHRKIQVVAAEC